MVSIVNQGTVLAMNRDNYPLNFKHLYVSHGVRALFVVNRLKGYKVENGNQYFCVKLFSHGNTAILCCSLLEVVSNDTWEIAAVASTIM